jgi:hypothetical protein
MFYFYIIRFLKVSADTTAEFVRSTEWSRICRLQTLLVLASAVSLGSELRGITVPLYVISTNSV